MKKKIIISIAVSLASLIALTVLNIEDINFEGINIFNFFGTVHLPKSEELVKTDKPDLPVVSDDSMLLSTGKDEKISTQLQDTIPSKPVINKPVSFPAINDTASTAFLIENNLEYSDTLIKKYDKRFYKLSLATTSTIALLFTASGSTSYNLNIQGSNSVNMNTEIYEERNFTKRMNVYLKAGTYTLQITGGTSWRENNAGNKYKIKTQISETENTEAESNNSVETANVIPINTDIKASSYEGDNDYFAFTLDRESLIFPKLDFSSVKGYDDFKLYKVQIKDEYGGSISDLAFIFRGNNQLSGKKKSANLKPGNYLVHVSRIEEKSKLELGHHEYTLRVSANT